MGLTGRSAWWLPGLWPAALVTLGDYGCTTTQLKGSKAAGG